MNTTNLLRIIFMTIAATSTSPVMSQPVNLRSILEASQKNYPLIKSRAAEVAGAEHDVMSSISEYIPRLTLQHQYTLGTSNSIAGSFYPNPAVISPSGGIRSENVYTATWGSYTTSLLEWNIFNFGKVAANVRTARANLTQTEAAYENELFQHQVRVADAYLLALIASKLVSIQEVNVERALRFRQVVNAGVRSGMRPGVDSSLAHAEYTKARLQLLDTKRNDKTQRYILAEMTGNIPLELPELDSMAFFTTLPILPDTSSISRESNPVLNLYSSRMHATEARSIAIKRSVFPSVTVIGAAWARGSGVSPDDDTFRTGFSEGTRYQVYNYLLGVSARWTLTEIIPVRQRFKSEKYRVVRDQELYNEQNLKVSRQQKESAMLYEVNLEQATTAPVQLEAARRAYRQAFARYKSGLTDLPTLLQSMVTLNRAEADLAVAYSNSWRALLSVAASRGDLSLFLETLTN